MKLRPGGIFIFAGFLLVAAFLAGIFVLAPDNKILFSPAKELTVNDLEVCVKDTNRKPS